MTRFLSRLAITMASSFLGLLPAAAPPEAIAWDQAPDAASAGESAVRRRILANWGTRQEQSNSLHFVWQTHWIPAKGNGWPSWQGQMELGMEGEPRCRLVASPDRQTGHGPDWQYAFDGQTSRQLDLGANGPWATVKSGDDGKQLDEIAVFPLLLALRPLSRGGVAHASQPLRVLTQDAIIDNKHYVKLQRVEPSFVESFWVDPNRDDVIVAWERVSRGHLQASVGVQYQHDREHGWVPARWTQTHAIFNKAVSENVMTRFAFNERFPEDTFTLTFPPRTTVTDKKAFEKYVVARDGSKTDVIKYDSLGSMEIYAALDQTVDFTIDPQPLKDALDFIAQRYQIKVTIDAEAVRQGRIDPKLEVKLPVTNIKLRSILHLLLEQSRKPLTYEVHNGVLTFIPATK